MINFSNLKYQLEKISSVTGYNEAVKLFKASDKSHIITNYIPDVALNELKVHRDHLLKAGSEIY